ncbi:MAG TPA: glycosyltransferase [Ignavibacteriales bacterium]|nr:glycosyltransferase [Ignavibacteriales bacterium]
MNVCAVIVTYNNRFNLLKEVIESLFKSDITGVIVVDNNSEAESRNRLKNLEEKNASKLKVIYLDENTGSAGGYSRGLKEFFRDEACDFVWLLDDDNVPEEGSLEVLKTFWQGLNEKDKESSVALLSSRPGREIYKTAVLQNKPDLVIGSMDGFLGFSIKGFFLRSLSHNSENNAVGAKGDLSHGNVSASYYGGLFFQKKLLDKIGYPNEDLFLYTDDTEYSNRIVRMGGRIIVLFNSRITDIDEKWFQPEDRATFLKLPLMNQTNKHRYYYQIRNRVYFEKFILNRHRLSYKLNKFLYLVILKLVLWMNKNKLNGRIISLAVGDGLKGNLGKKDTAYFN